MQYLDEAKFIWNEFVPKSGQAETVQGELLRVVEKLRDEATRNGNGNWDKGFEIFISFLRETLLDENVFDDNSINKIKSTLSRLEEEENPYLEDDLYDELGDRVVEYYKHYGSQPHKSNPELYR